MFINKLFTLISIHSLASVAMIFRRTQVFRIGEEKISMSLDLSQKIDKIIKVKEELHNLIVKENWIGKVSYKKLKGFF